MKNIEASRRTAGPSAPFPRPCRNPRALEAGSRPMRCCRHGSVARLACSVSSVRPTYPPHSAGDALAYYTRACRHSACPLPAAASYYRLANFNRHRTLFCCSGVCYSRCPRRREHYLARSWVSCAALKVVCATLLWRTTNNFCRTARQEEITIVLSARTTRGTRATICCMCVTSTLKSLKYFIARTVITLLDTTKSYCDIWKFTTN